VFDLKGNLYVCDTSHNVVVKITPSGIASIFAGNGSKGLSGDGGPATKASITTPLDLVCDANDNIYIADFDGGRVRKVTPDGIITSITGDGDGGTDPVEGVQASKTFMSPNGLAIDGSGNIYVLDGAHLRARKIRADGTVITVAGNGKAGTGGDGGSATKAEVFTYPGYQGLAVDASGNVYIGNDNFIRKVDTHGIITTIAG
jgi:sugar lactone lactonase YvrE